MPFMYNEVEYDDGILRCCAPYGNKKCFQRLEYKSIHILYNFEKKTWEIRIELNCIPITNKRTSHITYISLENCIKYNFFPKKLIDDLYDLYNNIKQENIKNEIDSFLKQIDNENIIIEDSWVIS